MSKLIGFSKVAKRPRKIKSKMTKKHQVNSKMTKKHQVNSKVDKKPKIYSKAADLKNTLKTETNRI